MLAELHSKVDPESTLASDRLEDTLTDAVFSAFRYLPRRVLGELIRLVLPAAEITDEQLEAATITFWPTFPSGLWPGRGIEPDVVVHVGTHVIVFEAKYHSGFGPYELNGQPLHQLAVQWRAVSAWAAGQRATSTTVVAVTTDPVTPSSLLLARADLATVAPELPAEQRQDAVRWVPWHVLAGVIRSADALRSHERAVQNDVLALMRRRGVSRVFDGFDADDYQLIATAQKAAATRLYPTISTFVQELTSQLDAVEIDWGWPYKGMWGTSGMGWTRPQDWVRDFVAAPYWSRRWPDRSKNSDAIALYVLFDFMNPAVEVGYVQSPPNAAAAQQYWQPHYGALATELAALSNDYSVAVDNGDWTTPAASAPVHEADAAWLGALGGYGHLRLRRRLDVAAVAATQAVAELVDETRLAVEQCPALHTMLKASQQLQA